MTGPADVERSARLKAAGAHRLTPAMAATLDAIHRMTAAGATIGLDAVAAEARLPRSTCAGALRRLRSAGLITPTPDADVLGALRPLVANIGPPAAEADPCPG